MPRKYRDSDDPIQPRTPYNASPYQGKLVLGSFENKPPQHQPYQYPPRQPAPPPPPYTGQRADLRPKRSLKQGILRFGCITMLLLIVLVTVLGFITVPRVLAFG